MKKNVLFMVAALLLCGAVSAQNWGTTDAHAKSSNTPIVAKVTVDGAAVTPTADYKLGAFVGEELRGLAAPHTEDNNFWIQVFYNQGTSETISFKLYDGTNEYTTCSVTKATQEEGWGTPSEPVALDFASTQSQSTQLAQGWSWWSTPIELSNIDGLTMLENSLGHNGLTIKSYNDFTINYYGETEDDLWYGGLEAINNEQFYMIETNSICPVVMVGAYANPSNHPISINENWNWIGYPVSTAQYVSVAMSSFESSNEDIIKDKTDFATYYEGYGWYPEDFTMAPGKGYMYKSNSSNSKTLVYSNSRTAVMEKPQAELSWIPEVHKFPYSASIIAVLNIDGKEIEDNIEIGAFVGNECRGSARLNYFMPTNRYYALLNVVGTNDEIISFKTIDNESVTSISFKQDGVFGSLDNPLVIEFGKLAETENYISVYPNPVKRNQSFKILVPEGEQASKIIISDMLGSIVYKEAINSDKVHGILTPGVYLLKIICDSGNVYLSKIVVE